MSGCPLGVDIPGFIRFLREGDAVSSIERIRQENPFPAICGRICPAPCERACIFHHEASSIGIRALERYAADLGQPKLNKKLTVTSNGKKIAVIGSGPAGLTAAYYLAHAGFAVTIIESMNEPGGLLRYGVPEFRLPQKVLDEQVALVRALGVEIQTNVFLGSTLTMAELFMQGFSAVLLAVGAGVPDFAQIPGENLAGVYYAEEFLMRLQVLGKENPSQVAGSLLKGVRTIIVGGSSSAFDAARMSVRLGQQVQVVFPGLEEEMEAHADDIKAALEEGVIIESPLEPSVIEEGDGGLVNGLRCRRLEIIEGEEGLVLEPTQEDVFFQAQTIILAHGRRPNGFIKAHLPQLRFNPDGTLWVDEANGQSSVEKVFACGNVVTGAGAVVDAIASGKAAAKKLVEFFKG